MLKSSKWLCSLVLASAGFLSAEYCSTNIYLAEPCHTFNAYYRALWLQPSASNLHYAVEADPASSPSQDWTIYDIRPDYKFGYEIGLGAIIHPRNTKLKCNWEHFTSRHHTSKNLSDANMIGPFFEIGPDAAPYNRAYARVNFDFDYAAVDYGILVNFGSHLLSNFYAGISGARLKEVIVTKFSNADETIHRTIKTPSRFLGIGPQFGVESEYSICKGLKLTGEASGALLIGCLSNHTNYKSYSPALGGLGIDPPNAQKTSSSHRTAVVPAFEGRLALGYSFKLKCFTCTEFDFEAGYKASIFINALQSTDIGSELTTPPVSPNTVGVYARTYQRTLSNYALAGPYISLNAKF